MEEKTYKTDVLGYTPITRSIFQVYEISLIFLFFASLVRVHVCTYDAFNSLKARKAGNVLFNSCGTENPLKFCIVDKCAYFR